MRDLMTGLDWKSANAPTVIHPCLEGNGSFAKTASAGQTIRKRGVPARDAPCSFCPLADGRVFCGYNATSNGQLLIFSLRFCLLVRSFSALVERTRSGSRVRSEKTRRRHGLFRRTSYPQPSASYQKGADRYANSPNRVVPLFRMDDWMGERAV